MISLRIAWRSLLRHRRRSIITASAIALGLAMLLVFVGLNDDAHYRMAEIGIRLGGGHVVVQGEGYQEEQTLEHLVDDPERVVRAARRLPQVAQVTERVSTGGLASSGSKSAAVQIAGVDPAREPLVSSIASPAKRIAGDYLRPREALPFAGQPGDVYIGHRLAEKLAVTVDDRLVLTVSPHGADRPAAAAFRVRGIFRTGVDELDGFYVQIPLGESQELLELGDAVTQIAILAEDLEETGPITRALREELDAADLEILPWPVTLRELAEGIQLDEISLYLFMAIIFVIVAIGIFNTVLMSVVERTREFGVMLAIGTSRSLLVSVILLEALLLGIIAAGVGLGIGLSLHFWLQEVGLDLSALYGEMEFAGIVFDTTIRSRLEAGDVVRWTLLVIGIAVLSAVYPALRASRLEPVEAMRHA